MVVCMYRRALWKIAWGCCGDHDTCIYSSIHVCMDKKSAFDCWVGEYLTGLQVHAYIHANIHVKQSANCEQHHSRWIHENAMHIRIHIYINTYTSKASGIINRHALTNEETYCQVCLRQLPRWIPDGTILHWPESWSRHGGPGARRAEAKHASLWACVCMCVCVYVCMIRPWQPTE